jgi:hypothetical protein
LLEGELFPGEYPLPADSYILRNDSDKTGCKFTNVTQDVAAGFTKLGLVTSALWTDVDKDGWMDLMIVGEFMPITCYKNNGGRTLCPFGKESLSHTSGWWNSLTAGDFDSDGDMDYIAGNLGLNTRYRGNQKEPLCIYANDYDKNGSIDPVMTYYCREQNILFTPVMNSLVRSGAMRLRFRSIKSMLMQRLKNPSFPRNWESAYVVCADWFETSYVENLATEIFGKGSAH